MPAVETRSMRERNRAAQRRYRNKKRDRLVAAEEKVAQLTAQLEAAHLEQVYALSAPPPLPLTLSSSEGLPRGLCVNAKGYQIEQ